MTNLYSSRVITPSRSTRDTTPLKVPRSVMGESGTYVETTSFFIAASHTTRARVRVQTRALDTSPIAGAQSRVAECLDRAS